MRATTWSLLMMLGLSIPLLQSTTTAAADNEATQAVFWPADPESARAEFRQTGSLTLAVPTFTTSPTGLLVIDGVDRTAESIDTNIYQIDDVNSIVSVIEVADVIIVHGAVRDYPASTAYLYLGQHGVYGVITIPTKTAEIQYWLDSNSPDEAAGLPFIQRASIDIHPLQASPAPNLSAPEAATAAAVSWTCPAVFPTARIQYISTEGFVSSNPASWYDRMVSANTADVPAWTPICITLTARFARTSNVVTGDSTHTSSSCGTALSQFQAWLVRNQYLIYGNLGSDQVGYQLWSSDDFTSSGIGSLCFGNAYTNSVTWQSLTGISRRNQALNAASIVEGRDVNCCDAYDPSELKQRAVVSGHELGHMFGEENHRSGSCSGGYNMMQDSGQLRRDNSVCFLTSSRYEINYWFFSHAEY